MMKLTFKLGGASLSPANARPTQIAVVKQCQTGSMQGTALNVRSNRGDVISPILSGAGLAHAMRKCKAKLFDHGALLGRDHFML